jgi:aminoglycoside phosphotransferase (APT) family kinase protein
MEYDLLKILQKHHLPVPSPVFLDDQEKIFNTPTLVLEFLPGELDFSADTQPARSIELARVTAGIHRINLQEIKDIAIPILGETINSLCGESPDEMDEVIDERGIHEFLQAHWPPKHPNRAVLLHGDIWNGNILWKDNRITGVIDWEDAWIGEPLLDIAGVRLDLACEFGIDLAEQFTREYLSLNPLDMRDLPLWDLVASLWFTRFLNEDFVRFPDFFAKYGRPDITIESMRCVVKDFSHQAIQRCEEND